VPFPRPHFHFPNENKKTDKKTKQRQKIKKSKKQTKQTKLFTKRKTDKERERRVCVRASSVIIIY
jgi:hypothetical protein